jgi:cell division protein FtsL
MSWYDAIMLAVVLIPGVTVMITHQIRIRRWEKETAEAEEKARQEHIRRLES